jgi:hypothetical protein
MHEDDLNINEAKREEVGNMEDIRGSRGRCED